MTVPLLLDCDPGIDDAVAIMLACASPEFDLLGVTTVSGNVGLEHTTRNARGLLALAGRPDVPVAAGAPRPLVRAQPARAAYVHGDDGIRGVPLPEPAAPLDPRHAVALLADTVAASTEPVTLAAVGPLTNVALFYALHPELAARLGGLVVMGGSVGAGNVTPAAEFNIWADPEAAYRVLTDPGLPHPVPTALVGLEVTFAVPMAGFGKAFDGPAMDPKVLEEQQKKLQSELEKRSEDMRKKLEAEKGGAAPSANAAPKP